MRKTEEIRNLIVEDRKKGETYAKISEKYSISIGGARKIFENFKKRKTCKTQYGGGPKPKISIHVERLMRRKVAENPEISSRELIESLDLDVSASTVQRKLRTFGLKNYVAKKRPLISIRNRKKRLQFAKQYVNMPTAFWERVIWSDESKFELRNSKKRKRVWCKPSDRLKPQCIQSTVKHGGGSLMVWGCFSKFGVGNLVKIDGRMTAASYVDVLSENLATSAEKMHLGSFIFQQDNDPKHTSRLATRFFEENDIEKLNWPAQSPDLNPIEHLWSILDSRIPKISRTNLESFFLEMRRQWVNIPSEILENLVRSMPKRLRAVIQSKGGNTNY